MAFPADISKTLVFGKTIREKQEDSMTRTEMLQIMDRLNDRANNLLLTGTDDLELFIGMTDVMPDFKALLDSPYKGEIDKQKARFPALHRYASVLSNIAEGIADGSIRVPR